MLKKLLLSLSILTISFSAQAQIPETEIFLADIELDKRIIKIDNVQNITKWKGYDNQPAFSQDGNTILFSSIRDKKQSDVYLYDINEKDTIQITDTEESEYSPTPIGKNTFSTVRVEKDESQRLWSFKKNNFKVLIKDIKTVGYHSWIDKDNIAMFLVGETHKLYTYNFPNKKLTLVAENIGRSIHKIPNENAISFVKKLSEEKWEIHSYDLKTKETTKIIRVLKGSEDYAWLPNGTILMGEGSKLFQYNPMQDRFWLEIIDFKDTELKNVNRISISPKLNKIAIVSNQ